jgi:hypothetical protein
MSLAMQLARRRAAGFGAFEPGWDDALGAPPPPDPSWGTDRVIIDATDGNDMPWWVSGAPAFGVIGKTLSNIFGNQYQQPNTVYRPATQQQYQVAPAGYYYNSSGALVQQSVGNITSFITNNPLLILGVVGGVILLFRPPPGRR